MKHNTHNTVVLISNVVISLLLIGAYSSKYDGSKVRVRLIF